MKNYNYSKTELPRYAELSNKSRTTYTQGDWTQIFPTIPIGLPYEDGPRTVMGVKY